MPVPGRDNRTHNRRLEVRHRAAEVLRDLYAPRDLTADERHLGMLLGDVHSVERIANLFAERLVAVFLKTDVAEAWSNFCGLRATTNGEELALLLNDREFRCMHRQLHHTLELLEPAIRNVVDARFSDRGLASVDHQQFSGPGNGSLAELRRGGLEVTIDADAVLDIDKAARDLDGLALPLSEVLKNRRFLAVSGKPASKLSLLVHDLVDHLWTFDLLDKVGVLEKFEDFLGSIGDPQLRDIRSREGEIVASIAFGIRAYEVNDFGMQTPFDGGTLLRVLRAHADRGVAAERHKEAIAILEDALGLDRRRIGSKPRLNVEAGSLAFAFSNYAVELNEQRRKHGRIVRRGLTGTEAELRLFDPDFVAFFVRVHHELRRPKNHHLRVLGRAQILIEEYVSDVASGIHNPVVPRRFGLEQLATFDPARSSVPRRRVTWILAHPGFAASPRSIL